jgi:hypothetical protein
LLDLSHEALNGEPDDRADPHPDERPAPLARGIEGLAEDHDRNGEHHEHDHESEGELAAAPIQGQPEDRKQDQRAVSGGGSPLGMAKEANDQEVGQRRQDLSPRRQPLPGNEDGGDDDQGGEGGGPHESDHVLFVRGQGYEQESPATCHDEGCGPAPEVSMRQR